ncbi:hypothetical protein ABBQ38_007704 [Trebouxia sp. C0009 RCD-2024]
MHACQRGNAHGWMRLAVKQAILVPGQATPGLSYLWQNQHLPYTQTNKSSQYFEDEHVRESNLGGVIAVADMTKPPRHTRQTHDQDMVPWRCTRTHKSGPTRGAAAVYGDYSTAGQVFAAQGPVMVQITALQVFRQRKHWLCYIGLTAELLLSFGLAAVSPLSRQVCRSWVGCKLRGLISAVWIPCRNLLGTLSSHPHATLLRHDGKC